MKIRCRSKKPCLRRAQVKFKCRWCKAWVCGICEGTHDPKDPVGNALCDTCWNRRKKRNKPTVIFTTMYATIEEPLVWVDRYTGNP